MTMVVVSLESWLARAAAAHVVFMAGAGSGEDG